MNAYICTRARVVYIWVDRKGGVWLDSMSGIEMWLCEELWRNCVLLGLVLVVLIGFGYNVSIVERCDRKT